MPKVTRPNRRDALISYIRVQENFDRQVYALLRRAASDVHKDILALVGRENIGAVIRREQFLAVKRTIHERLSVILEREGFLIAAAQDKAAAAAVETFAAYERVLFQTLTNKHNVAALLQSANLTSSAGIQAAIQRMQGASYFPLSSRVYKTLQWTTGLVDRTVESAIARGLNAREIANLVRGMIRPDVPGGVSYAALRLGRTELNNAFHAVQAEKARTSPWITGVIWCLSNSHGNDDECDRYAGTAHYPNSEAGFYKPEDVPMKPHPNCLCYTIPVTPSEDEFLDSFFKGEYDSGIADVAARDGFIF